MTICRFMCVLFGLIALVELETDLMAARYESQLGLLNIPRPKVVEVYNGKLSVGSNSMLDIPNEFKYRFRSSFAEFVTTINQIPAKDNSATIRIRITPETVKKEGYVLKVYQGEVSITASDLLGALHGLTTLETIIKIKGGFIDECLISDWPDLEVRALHFQVFGVAAEDARSLIKSARRGHFNKVVLDLAYGVRGMKSMANVSLQESMTKEALLGLVGYARESGMEIVPELPLLTHQERLLGIAPSFKSLLFDKFTYNPGKEETYQAILPMMDEIIQLIGPKAFHIGHDELWSVKPQCTTDKPPENVPVLEHKMMLYDIERLHTHLKKKGIETWMWGDMLISPDEFKEAREVKPCMEGYFGLKGYATLRKIISKEIVICDWHYFGKNAEFPSTSAFVKDGFNVIGSSWESPEVIVNFSQYVSSMASPRIRGMMATTWFYVHQKKWDRVNNIIHLSGNAFWNSGGGR